MIYFIQAQSGPIKIGIANDPVLRLNQMQVGNHEKLAIIGLMRGDANAEAILHERFSQFNIRGEWYMPCPLLLNMISNLEHINGFVEGGEALNARGGAAQFVVVEIGQSGDEEEIDGPPIAIHKMEELAKELASGVPFSHVGCTGSRGVLSRKQFNSLRDWMLEKGYAEWKNGDTRLQGMQLTQKGDLFMETMLSANGEDGLPAPSSTDAPA